MESPDRNHHMSSPTEGASSPAAGEAQDGGSLSGDEEEEEEEPAQLQPMICLIHEQAKSMVAIQELQRDVDILLEFREQLLSSLGGLYTSGAGTPRGLSSPGPGSGSGRISRHHSQPTIGAASAPKRGFSLSPASRALGVKTPTSHTSAFRRHYTTAKDLPSKLRGAENDSETVDTSDEMDGRHPWSRRGVGSAGVLQAGHTAAPRYHHTARARTRRRLGAGAAGGGSPTANEIFPAGTKEANPEPTNVPLVQDSGFSTETKDNSSSGEAHNNTRSSASLATPTTAAAGSDRTLASSSSSSERNLVYSDWMPDIRWSEGKKFGSQFDADAEDELWNLLDVIHRKGVRLRKEASDSSAPVDKSEPQAPPVSVENIISELEALRAERDRLQDEVLDLKRENLTSKTHINSLHDQVLKVNEEKRRLEDQLKTAVSWKTELDNRIHDMHLQFVKSPSHGAKTSPSTTSTAEAKPRKEKPQSGLARVQYADGHPDDLDRSDDDETRVESDGQVGGGHGGDAGAAADEAAAVKKLRSRSEDNLPRNPAPLPSLPVSLPVGKITVPPNRRKISAVLQEKDILVLKKQLLLYIQVYELTKARLTGVQREWASRVNEWENISQEWQDELTSLRDQNQDLRFQVEEKNIELEGTKARLRMLERSLRTSSPSPTCATPSPASTIPRQSLKRSEKSSNLTQKLPLPENQVILEEYEGVGKEPKKMERKGSVRFQLGAEEEAKLQAASKTVDPAAVTVSVGVGVTDIGHKDDRESSSTESSSGKVGNNFLDGKPPAENGTSPPVNFSSVIPYRPGLSKQELVQSQSHNFFFARDSPPVFSPSLRTYSSTNINNNNNNKTTSPIARKSSLSTNNVTTNLDNGNRWKSSKNSELLAKVISAATPAEFHSHVVDSHHHISAGDHIISNPQKARQRTSFWRSWWKFS